MVTREYQYEPWLWEKGNPLMTEPIKRTRDEPAAGNGRKASVKMKPADWITVSEQLLKLGADVAVAKHGLTPPETSPRRRRASD